MQERSEAEEPSAVVIDPICGQPIIAGDDAAVSVRHAGITWRFCSRACEGHFRQLCDRARMGEALRTGRFFAPSRRLRWGTA